MTDKIETDIETLKKAVREVNSEESWWIDQKTHELHHRYVQLEIQKKEKRSALNEKIKAQIIGWGMISIISGMLALIGKAIYDLLRAKQ